MVFLLATFATLAWQAGFPGVTSNVATSLASQRVPMLAMQVVSTVLDLTTI